MSMLATQAISDEDYAHFPALESNNIQSALCNLQSYNKKLSDLLKKSSLSTEDMVKVHELTYTLENAVNFLKASLEETSVTLEEVHKASEVLNAKVIQDSGKEYLDETNPLGVSTQCES